MLAFIFFYIIYTTTVCKINTCRWERRHNCLQCRFNIRTIQRVPRVKVKHIFTIKIHIVLIPVKCKSGKLAQKHSHSHLHFSINGHTPVQLHNESRHTCSVITTACRNICMHYHLGAIHHSTSKIHITRHILALTRKQKKERVEMCADLKSCQVNHVEQNFRR